MNDRAKEARRVYMRACRAAHPEKTREYNARKFEKFADKLGIPRESSSDQSKED